jgi:hypothetical protein
MEQLESAHVYTEKRKKKPHIFLSILPANLLQQILLFLYLIITTYV